MAKLVLGRSVIDNGPCVDMQAQNMAELSALLDALGNPAPDPGPGPIDPITGDTIVTEEGDTYENVYINVDGDLVYVDENGNVIIISIGGSGTDSDTKTFYNLVWGSPSPTTGGFDMVVAGIHDAITVHVPKGTYPNPSPTPAPLVGTTINVTNSPNIVWLEGDVVYARYDHIAGAWDTDSSHNWVAIARGRPGWELSKKQGLVHEQDSRSIVWAPNDSGVPIYVKSLVPAAEMTIDSDTDTITSMTPGKYTNGRRMIWNSGALEPEMDGLVEVTVNVYNLSQTVLEGHTVHMGTQSGDGYIVAWPDLAGTPGHAEASDLVIYTAAGENNYQAAGAECD